MIKTALASYRSLMRYRQIRHDPVAYARSIGVRVGTNCWLLGLQPATFGSEPYLITLGNHVTVTSGVRFVTHDGGIVVFHDRYPDIDMIAPIVVGDNVFIGLRAIIMPGVTIGNNCIIGAGSVVTRDIPAGSVVAGVPARCIKSIDEYWEKVKDKALHTRSLAAPEKRKFLIQLFGAE